MNKTLKTHEYQFTNIKTLLAHLIVLKQNSSPHKVN